ncbi:Transposon Ty3-I Gag-Pol polyprotein [Senna tora]|uniref:Transposon Ty3-I Gag-Pol polyprotein n=1 Tax=Senna tora TaxID=362788 RepID=A0A834W1B1_9FABA|nr:Transposon Ty3-I Gag-Pol polyprotein [Senna tora]
MIAVVHFEGVVVPWFQMMSKSSRVDSWVALSKAIEVEFEPSQFESPRALLFKLYQKTSVADSYKEFMILATRVEGISDEALLDCFISGLKPSVRRDVIAQAPSSLPRATALARLFDERSSMAFSSSSSRGSFTPLTSLVPVPSPQVVAPLSSSTSLVPFSPTPASLSSTTAKKSSLPPLLPTPNVQPLRSVKRMSAAEMQLRCEKKLCFTCDAPYSWSHKSPNKQYMILQIEDDDEDDSSSVEIPSDISPSDPSSSDPPPHHLSLNALSGEHAVGTIRFTGVIQGVDVQVLLDGDSSDTFIQPRVVRTFKLAVEPVTPFKRHEIMISAHVLDVTRADVILGAQWLATLGPHIADYSTATIKFYCNGQFITLHALTDFSHGVRCSSRSPAATLAWSPNSLARRQAGEARCVEMDPSKIKAIIDWPLPASIKQLRGFLGLSSYYCRFIHHYAAIAAPLTSLLKKEEFKWSDDAVTSFNALKAAITSALVLVLPDFSKPFTIETDASGLGIGAMLSQEGRPIAFFSKKDVDSNAASICLCLRDHLSDQTLKTPEQEEWLPNLLGFQFTIEYKPGKLNTVADALSRSFFVACSSPVFTILDDIRRALPEDPTTAQIISSVLITP